MRRYVSLITIIIMAIVIMPSCGNTTKSDRKKEEFFSTECENKYTDSKFKMTYVEFIDNYNEMNKKVMATNEEYFPDLSSWNEEQKDDSSTLYNYMINNERLYKIEISKEGDFISYISDGENFANDLAITIAAFTGVNQTSEIKKLYETTKALARSKDDFDNGWDKLYVSGILVEISDDNIQYYASSEDYVDKKLNGQCKKIELDKLMEGVDYDKNIYKGYEEKNKELMSEANEMMSKKNLTTEEYQEKIKNKWQEISNKSNGEWNVRQVDKTVALVSKKYELNQNGLEYYIMFASRVDEEKYATVDLVLMDNKNIIFDEYNEGVSRVVISGNNSSAYYGTIYENNKEMKDGDVHYMDIPIWQSDITSDANKSYDSLCNVVKGDEKVSISMIVYPDGVDVDMTEEMKNIMRQTTDYIEDLAGYYKK